MRRLIEILFISAFLMSGILGVSAANTHVNITVSEVVHQNITFAENFYLVENRTYQLIEGTLTVANPGAETVFDIEVEFDNVMDMNTDFIHTGGRLGYHTRFYQNSSWAEYNAINTTVIALNSTNQASAEPANVVQDLDDDGSVDFVSVNSTHMLFNLTSQYDQVAVELVDNGVPVDLSNAGTVAVTISTLANITSLPDGDDPILTFGTVNITGTTNTDDQIDAGVLVNITDAARTTAKIHIPELRGGQNTVFNYNISGSVTPPLDIDTNYTHQYNRKVLAGDRMTINDTVSNVISLGLPVTNINITIEALNIIWNGTDFNFTLHNLSETGDYANLDGNGTSNRTWYWAPSGGTLNYLENANITYQVQAPYSVYTTGQYAAVKQTLQYRVNYAASNITVVDVDSRAKLEFNTTKEIISPADNLQNRNVTWESLPRVGAAENITYTLQKVSLWVTTDIDPNQPTTLTKDYDADVEINQSNPWTGGASDPWHFNFTDGSSDSYPPPIVWIKPYWIITNNYNQILNQSYTVNGTDLYIKYIYVINGYWLEVDKNITSLDNDTYQIYTWVHNRGNGWTPENMTVTVYDFVPNQFTAYNWTISPNNESNVTGEFAGVAYRWDIGLKAPYSASLAPDDGAAGGQDEWSVTYEVNGTGDYVVSDLYIVGLDPRKVDGANWSPAIAVIAGIKSIPREPIYVAVVLALVALNAVNLLMTKKIDKKLDSHNKDVYSKILHEMKNARKGK